ARDRIPGGAIRADGDAGAEAAVERVADAHDGHFAPTERRIGTLDLGHVAGDGKALPADGYAEVIAAWSQGIDGHGRQARLRHRGLARRIDAGADRDPDLRRTSLGRRGRELEIGQRKALAGKGG